MSPHFSWRLILGMFAVEQFGKLGEVVGNLFLSEFTIFYH